MTWNRHVTEGPLGQQWLRVPRLHEGRHEKTGLATDLWNTGSLSGIAVLQTSLHLFLEQLVDKYSLDRAQILLLSLLLLLSSSKFVGQLGEKVVHLLNK